MKTQSDAVRIFHNPRCNKSCATLSILTENGTSPTVIEYLETHPTVEELTCILRLLDLEPRELMRKHEAPYKDNNLNNATLSCEQLIQAMVENPILIERPVIIKGNHAIIGRPPEKILELL